MSSKPSRNRRTRRQFIDKAEEEGESEVIEESQASQVTEPGSSQANKIDEKHGDRYDPHMMTDNVFGSKKEPKSQLFDLDEEEEDATEEMTNQTECLDGNSEIRQPQEPRSMKKRERGGRREKKKIISSDQEEKISEEKEEEKPEWKGHRPQQMLSQDNDVPFVKQQSAINIPQGQQLEDIEEDPDQAPAMKPQMSQGPASKKEVVESPQKEKHVFMHVLLNKAGFSKEDRKEVVHRPLAPGEASFVYFKRYQDGFSETFQCIGQDQRPILFCQNQRGCIGCNYYISLTKEMNKGSPAYVGKLRGDAAGATYNLFDHGQQPNNEIDRSQFRVSMAFIEYESNFLGMKGPRKLRTIIPNMKEHPEVDWDMYKFAEEETLKTFEGSSTVVTYRNKQPRWNERLNSYALNFGGRVKKPSIKNFILTEDHYTAEEEEKSPSSVIFGKIDETTFALQFRHPFSLFQAFGLALSEFDYKLKCE